ncbi:hypothetical protein L4C36_20805 [Photobacterium japonica]|uniref:LysM-like peptidoglycan-binding domain-containing protein n=1 Tax=Photobacterium japonica TaxID=2910235 RepID=UPI003D0F3AAC
MGQAKRRSKKQSEFSWPRIAFDKAMLANAKAACQQRTAALRARWQGLPTFHRRALMVLTPVVAILLLLPSTPPALQDDGPIRRELALDIDTRPEPVTLGERGEPASPERPIRLPRESRVIPLDPVAEKPAVKPAPKPARTDSSRADTSRDAWQRYQVKPGETLANIFRDKSLPLADLYAVAAIEGKDQPLSQIKPGQWLLYRQTGDGQLEALLIEAKEGDESVGFSRNADGKFVRSRQ